MQLSKLINIVLIGLLSILLAACYQEKSAKKLEQDSSVQSTPEIREVKEVIVFTTAKDADQKFHKSTYQKLEKAKQPLETEISVFIEPHKKFQEFIGIGGAITDASAEVYHKLSKGKQQELLDAYYSDQGIDYTLIRTNIHSCDFSPYSYTYIEEGDSSLSSFDIAHDTLYRIPMIKKAMSNSKEYIKVYASPWSPPAFMKSNQNMLKGGRLLDKYYPAWANYYAKFIKAYEQEGIPIWGLTIQNEPMATQRWESCIYTAKEERDFLKDHLGPTLKKNGFGDKKIIVWDHNRDLIVNRANTILGDPEAAKYVFGIGFHWYETWTGSEPNFQNLKAVNESYPDKALIFTEGCNEAFDSLKYQYWPNAERYGFSMINDFNNGTGAWTDWNILLDHNGGPNHVQNFCFAPIHADTRFDKLIYTPSYYYIGHFSKFIKPGAKRMSTSVSRTYLQATSFENPDGSYVTVIMNKTDENIDFNLYVNDQQLSLTSRPHSIQTLVY